MQRAATARRAGRDRRRSAPSERLPTTSVTATSAEQARLLPARPRPDPAEDARAGRRAAPVDGRGVAGASSPGSLETQPDLADLDLVAEGQRRDALDAASPLTYGPVRAPEVLDVPAAAAEGQDRVLRRRERVVDDDGVVDVAAERRDGVERERRAGGGSPAGEATTTSRPSSAVRLARRGAAGRAAGPGRPGTGRRRGGRGTARRSSQRRTSEAVHQPEASSTSTSSVRLAEPDPVARAQHHLADALAVDLGPVRAAEVA